MKNHPTQLVSRREFLKHTGRLATVSALAGVTIPYVHAAGSDLIRVALIGCGGRGTGAASQALSCANLALADFDPVIPLDEVIAAARRVADQMPRELRCTALGGLSITPTSLALEQQLAARRTDVRNSMPIRHICISPSDFHKQRS